VIGAQSSGTSGSGGNGWHFMSGCALDLSTNPAVCSGFLFRGILLPFGGPPE
jgi:hypothetical protein